VVSEHLVDGSCSVVVGRGLLSPEGVLPSSARAAVAIVTQPTTERLGSGLARSMGEAGLRTAVRVLPDGDDAKDLGVITGLYQWMAGIGLTRADTVVAVGGGALTDAAGFAAATYLRGIEAVFVPTTLLAAVDAAIGGKTGVNLGAKNLVGAFRHPSRVVIDVDVLDRLPAGLKRQGAAEALKAGLVGDEGLMVLLESDGLDADLEQIVNRAVAVKVQIVNRDFEERGERAHLNYGHTVGHAVEVTGHMGHGEAVAIGMVAAGRASALEVGFTGEQRQRDVIAGLGLPVAAPGLDRVAVLSLLAHDKKRDTGGVRMVLLEAIGRPLVTHVGSATVGAALTAVDIP